MIKISMLIVIVILYGCHNNNGSVDSNISNGSVDSNISNGSVEVVELCKKCPEFILSECVTDDNCKCKAVTLKNDDADCVCVGYVKEEI